MNTFLYRYSSTGARHPRWWFVRAYWWIMNRVRRLGFYETEDGCIGIKPGTCPVPIDADWRAKTCIRQGNCGCDEGDLHRQGAP